jgi:N-acetylmuramic acid 6-phosphate etherase
MPHPSPHARAAAADFLKIAGDFSLGDLVTESAHPRSSTLSETARASVARGLATLFDVDADVVAKYDQWSRSAQPDRLADAATGALRAGGRLFFTGCGATGRLSIQLDAIWRRFWQDRRTRGLARPDPDVWEFRTRSVMAGGDFALIKSVEGFEDFSPFGRRQIADLGLASGDVVFAITEGGETSFVIGTAWQGLESGARVFFVYNNPDDVLRAHVRRSREVLDEPRIEKVNLTTGPMAITGSTRMQATSIELFAMLTVLEMTLRNIISDAGVLDASLGPAAEVPAAMRRGLADVHATLSGDRMCASIARLVDMEETIYRAGRRTSYFADALAVDVLTDTTERSPTYCTPAFRKWDDEAAAESWAFLFVPEEATEAAWRRVLRRGTQTIEWTPEDLLALLEPDAAARQGQVLGAITRAELMRFRIGLDGIACRPVRSLDGVIAVVSEPDVALVDRPDGAFTSVLTAARAAGAAGALVGVGREPMIASLASSAARAQVNVFVGLTVPDAPFLLDPLTRIGAKMLLNALSTCTMVRLGRVLGNRMIWVVPSNLKLIDRSTRYIRDLAGVSYEDACTALFEVIEYIEPRRRAGQSYPAPVGVATMRLRHNLDLAEAEARLAAELV